MEKREEGNIKHGEAEKNNLKLSFKERSSPREIKIKANQREEASL